MKQEKLIILKELLTVQMNHWGLFPLAVTTAGLAGMTHMVLWQWLLCSLVPFAFFLVRRYTNRFFILAASHGAVWFIFWYLPHPNLIMKAALMVFVTGYILYSVVIRVKEEDRLDGNLNPIFTVGVSAAALMLLHYRGQTGWDMYYIIPLAVFMGLFFLHYYLEHYLHFLAVNESSTGHIPKQEIFRSGMGLAAAYTAAGVLLLFLSSGTGWLGQILGAFRRLLVWLLGFLPSGSEDAQVIPEPEPEVMPESGGMMPMEEGEPFWLWVVFEKLFMTAAFILLAAAVLWGLVKLFRYLAERFRTKGKAADFELETVKDVREKCSVERARTGKKSVWSYLGARERIRRIYKKRIWASREELAAGMDAKTLRIYTAQECCSKLGEKELAEVYEKARYSDRACTNEDIKRAKG